MNTDCPTDPRTASTGPAPVRRLGVTAVLAAAALFAATTGTVADPATAGAKPKDHGFNRAAYENCAADVLDAFGQGDLPATDVYKEFAVCCESYGGEWVEDLESGRESCQAPLDGEQGPPDQAPGPSEQLPQPPPGQTEATRPPAPPAGPILQTPLPPAQQQAPRWHRRPSAETR